MKIESVKYEDGELKLKISSPATEVYRLIYEFKPGDYELTKKKKKRSKESNAYAWELIDQIAQKTHYSKSEIYRNAIRDIGGNSTMVCVEQDKVEGFCKRWSKFGLGWQTETMESKIPGCVNVICYSGSSEYDTRQMSLLLDHLIEDARQLGIETLPEDKLELMKENI